MVEIVVAEADMGPDDMAEAREAARLAVLDHIARCVNRPRRVVVTADNDGWCIRLDGAQPDIVRMRRITGYLSSLSRFGKAKLAETRDRMPHRSLSHKVADGLSLSSI